MINISAQTPDEALAGAMIRFNSRDPRVVRELPSRNGPMLELTEPVCTIFTRPRQRVIFSPDRRANPFFHFFEAMWMLAGDDRVDVPAMFAKNLLNYSDDGMSLNGAYGYRWRRHFGTDQIHTLIQELRKDPYSRRAVLAMWDPEKDFPTWSKDHPCNTHIYFKIRNNRLRMTVCNRSNDAIWGAYGANVVHFSFLQEYLAGILEVEVGEYYQISDSLHIYPELEVTKRMINSAPYFLNQYTPHFIGPEITRNDAQWRVDQDIDMLMIGLRHERSPIEVDFQSVFFRSVVRPLWSAWNHNKAGRIDRVMDSLDLCGAPDWKKACQEWCDDQYERKVGPYAEQ